MAKNLRPPDKLSLDGNLKANFRRFKQQFQLYMTATGQNDKENDVKSSTLLTAIGPEALEVYNTFNWQETGDEDGNDMNVDTILTKFETYCNPRKNVAYERHVFNTRVQRECESIDTYATELKILASSCEFGDLKESLIRDRIVFGVKEENIRLRLLREQDHTLQSAMDICSASESSEQQTKTMAGKMQDVSLNAIKGKTYKYKKKYKQPEAHNPCGKCGIQHLPRQCPAYGKVCHKCHIKNHFKKMCRGKMSKVRSVDTESERDDEYNYMGVLYDSVNALNSDWMLNCKIQNKTVNCLVDTGARCNVISVKIMKKMKINGRLEEPKVTLRSYSGHSIKPLGSISLECTVNDKTEKLKFQVVREKRETILGGCSCAKLGLIKKLFHCDSESQDVTEAYKDVFEGIGCLPGKHTIQIDSDVQSVVHPPRKVPLKLQDKVKAELKRMECENIIIRETEPTPWVNSMVTVLKPDGSVRICLDPKDLNIAVKRQHYPLKTVEEVISKMPGAQYFSKLDATSSFWQIELDEKSSKLCTFNTPFGRYRYLRLPYGVHSAPEVMQFVMTSMFENIEGVEVIMDDILVTAKALDEHDRRLEMVLKHDRESKQK